MIRRDDSLIGQVVAANVVLVALTLFAASLAAGLDLTVADQRWSFLILSLSIVLTLCVNLWMLQRRFRPLEHLIDRIETIDPAEPSTYSLGDPEPVEEIDRLTQSFRRLLDRIEEERRRSGALAMRAQEEERRRLARDLHDEVNQALTAILLRLEALSQDAPAERADEVSELKRLVNQAMEELLHARAPTAAVGARRPRARAGARGAAEALRRAHRHRGAPADRGRPEPAPRGRADRLFRVTQEALANAGRHAGATAVEVDLAFEDGRVDLRVRDDGEGFDPERCPARTAAARVSGSAAWPSGRVSWAASSTFAPPPAAAPP